MLPVEVLTNKEDVKQIKSLFGVLKDSDPET